MYVVQYMQPAIYFRSHTEYLTVPSRHQQVPHIVTITPVNPPLVSNEYFAAEVVAMIRATIYQSDPSMSTNQLNQLMVAVSAMNIDSSAYHSFESFQRLDFLQPYDLLRLVERIQQSNMLVTFADLEWRIFIDSNSFNRGRGSSSFTGVGLPTTRLKHHFREEPLSCMAFALVTLTRTANKTQLYRETKRLMTRLSWQEETSVGMLQQYVDCYPQYRVVVLLPHLLRIPEKHIFTGTAWEFTASKGHLNNLYLIYDLANEHFSAIKKPDAMFRKNLNSRRHLCSFCLQVYFDGQGHECGEFQIRKKDPPQIRCQLCGITGKHKCTMRECQFCYVGYYKDDFSHRCLIVDTEPERKIVYQSSDISQNKNGPYALFAWDCESRFEKKKTARLQYEFEVKEGKYTGEARTVQFMQEHIVNYVVFKNVYTGDGAEFAGDDCLAKMLEWLLSYNGGRNILIAHNSGGYDSRLLFQIAKEMDCKTDMFTIMKGQKFMSLKINKLQFIDSMLHVKGSLKNLAHDYGAITEKGYFPYLFNTKENWDYRGPIPDKEYFDLTTSAKSRQDLDSFHEWYDSFEGVYDFQAEMKKYCRNDVDILATIIRGYDECCQKLYGISPWFYKTAPGFNRAGIVKNLTKLMELPERKSEDYIPKINRLLETSWVNLRPQEYWSARAALRGGRTNISCMLKILTDEELAKGYRICYQDVNSLYPSEQFFRKFPVGVPTIHVFDHLYKPCNAPYHRNSFQCNCTHPMPIEGLRVQYHPEPFSTDRILETHGFFHCSVRPPKKMLHPLLVCFDNEKKKCMATLNEDDYKNQCFTSAELHEAIRHGYVVTELFRIDEYRMSDEQWPDQIGPLYVEKTINSSNPPANVPEYIKKWRDWAGDDIADALLAAIQEGRFKKNPAMKMTAKIACNSGWGKHAQRPNMTKTLIYNHDQDFDKICDLYTNCINKEYQFLHATTLSENKTQFNIIDHQDRATDTHGMYIPTAVFVPSYGRLTLWKQLNLLGDRVLMCDTDSIVYVYQPESYNIPEGDLLGQWSIEDIDSKHGGIVEFVGLGPKTYSCKARDGTTLVKAKGISLKYATSDIVNHETMVQHAKKYLTTGVVDDFRVPSMTFEGNIMSGLSTARFFKDFGIRPHEFKGELRGTYFYPFGFDK